MKLSAAFNALGAPPVSATRDSMIGSIACLPLYPAMQLLRAVLLFAVDCRSPATHNWRSWLTGWLAALFRRRKDAQTRH